MSIGKMVNKLIEHFGTGEIATREVLKYIAEIGENPNCYYDALRNAYSTRRGVMQFTAVELAGTVAAEPVVEETDTEVDARLTKRFDALATIVKATAHGLNKSLIVSGPAGVGKSYEVEKAVREAVGDFTHIKGYTRATGLFKQLYQNRESDQTIVFDDIDSLFSDETSLNLLKCVCENSDKRTVSWLSNSVMETEDGEQLPQSFTFNGNIVFITNKDFEKMIAKDNKLAPHLEAMLSRSFYLDIGIKSVRDYFIRIKHVVDEGMLDDQISYEDQQNLMHYLKTNAAHMRDISLRTVGKLATLIKIDAKNWKEMAKIFCQTNN